MNQPTGTGYPTGHAYPQQAPQQHQAPPQQGMQAPSLGLGGVGLGGMPRLSFDGGSFSPDALKAAVFEGKGFAKPRLFGAIFFALALAFTVGNYVLVMVLHRFYPYLYSLAAIFAWGGLWLLVTGQPRAKADGSKAAMWGRVGLAGFLGIGVLLGIAMVVLPWESMIGM